MEPGSGWSTPSEVAEWEGKWRCANEKPLELWKSQGTGIGLPMIIPLRHFEENLEETGPCWTSWSVQGREPSKGSQP